MGTKKRMPKPLDATDGMPRLIIVATPNPNPDEPTKFCATGYAVNTDDPVLLWDMVLGVLPEMSRNAFLASVRAAVDAERANGAGGEASDDPR